MTKKELAVLTKKSERAALETEKTLAYLVTRMEAVRIREDIPAKYYAKMLGFKTEYAYAKVFQDKGRYASPYAFPIVQFCYLFGYDLAVDDDAIIARKASDIAVMELGALFASLPENVFNEIRQLVRTADFGDDEGSIVTKRRAISVLSNAANMLYHKSEEDAQGDDSIPINKQLKAPQNRK